MEREIPKYAAVAVAELDLSLSERGQTLSSMTSSMGRIG
jgi:hypothetical protein